MNELAQGHASFSRSEVAECKKRAKSGATLKRLYIQKTNYGLQKPKLSGILAKHMLSANSRRKIESRPLIKVLERVARLAVDNPFPTTHEIREVNQASKYLGMKRKPVKRQKGA